MKGIHLEKEGFGGIGGGVGAWIVVSLGHIWRCKCWGHYKLGDVLGECGEQCKFYGYTGTRSAVSYWGA
jgi:hypothetical protein